MFKAIVIVILPKKAKYDKLSSVKPTTITISWLLLFKNCLLQNVYNNLVLKNDLHLYMI